MHIDLHWRINNRQSLAQAYSVAELDRDGHSLEALNHKVVVPSSVDSLLIACLHRLGHHASEERLIWLYDICLLANKLSQQDWHNLVIKAQKKHLCAIVADGLSSSQSLLQCQIPNQVLADLRQANDEPSAIFTNRALPEWRYFMCDMMSMPSLTARLGFIRETLLPSPAYVRQQMGTRSTLVAYLRRLIRGFKRVREV